MLEVVNLNAHLVHRNIMGIQLLGNVFSHVQLILNIIMLTMMTELAEQTVQVLG
jgi:hypothetical protein